MDFLLFSEVNLNILGLYKVFWYTGSAFTKHFNHNNHNLGHGKYWLAASDVYLIYSVIDTYKLNQLRPIISDESAFEIINQFVCS